MDDVETRTVMSLRTGTKICVLVGLAFIVLGVYLFVVPITSVRTTTGAVFGCGTALNPAHGSFADGVCWRIADANRYRAFAALAVGLVTIIAGGIMFGVDRREEQRRIPRNHHEFGAEDRDGQRRDHDWTDDAPRIRRDRRAADERRQDDQQYDDRDDEPSSRRLSTDDRDDHRYDRRVPDRSAPDEH